MLYFILGEIFSYKSSICQLFELCFSSDRTYSNFVVKFSQSNNHTIMPNKFYLQKNTVSHQLFYKYLTFLKTTAV